jgi:putative ABC transport system substrate-binding protein
MIRRREIITLLGGAAAWPLAGHAQQRARPVIGYLSGMTENSDASMLVSVRRGLADVGYAEGRNVAIEYRFADGRYDRLSAQLADLTQRKVGVIVFVGGSRSRNWCSKSAPRRSRSCSAQASIRSAGASWPA